MKNDIYVYEQGWWGLQKPKILGKFLYEKGNYIYYERDGIVYSKYNFNESGSDKLCFFPCVLFLIFILSVLIHEFILYFS